MSRKHGVRNPVLGDGTLPCSIECACGWRVAGLESSAAAWSQLVHHLLDVLDQAPVESILRERTLPEKVEHLILAVALLEGRMGTVERRVGAAYRQGWQDAMSQSHPPQARR